jgi:hypothetical protein
VAVLAVIRSRRARCEHGRLPSGARVGCRRLGGPRSAPAGATPRASEQSRRRRTTDDHRIGAPLAIAQQGCGARSAGRRRGRRAAAAVTVATADETESRCQGTAPGSEEAAHRRQATASPTRRLTTEVALLDDRRWSGESLHARRKRRRLRSGRNRARPLLIPGPGGRVDAGYLSPGSGEGCISRRQRAARSRETPGAPFRVPGCSRASGSRPRARC